MKLIKSIIMTVAVLFASSQAFAASPAVDNFQKKVTESLALLAKANQTNVDQLFVLQEDLAKLGTQIAAEQQQKHPEAQKLFAYLNENIEKIKGLNADTIVAQWHHGEAFKAAGIDHDSFDHYGAVISAKDCVVQPLTALALLKEYKVTGNQKLLVSAREELEEILAQSKQIN